MDWPKVLDKANGEENPYKREFWWSLARFHYYQIKLNWLYQEKNYNKMHISLGLVNGKLQLTYQSHKDFIAATYASLREYRKKHRGEKLFKFAIEKALDGCHFIIFSEVDDVKKFIQFCTWGKRLYMDFPMNNENGLNKYYEAILEKIMDYGFQHVDNCYDDENNDKKCFSIKKEGTWTAVNANFLQDSALAAKFVAEAFTKILKIKLKKTMVMVE